MKTKLLLMLLAVAMATLAIGQVQAETIAVPNGGFELVYKPGSTTITADLDGGWTWGVGPDTPMNGAQVALYSDGTQGTTVDIPGWINAGAPWDVPPYDWTQGSGSVTNQSAAPDGDYYFTANGAGWGNAAGGAIESDAPLGIVNGGTYTLSMLVNGSIVPVVLDLLANGVALTPSSTVDPGAPYDWDEFSRTYDEASLTGHFGESLTIRVGWGPDTCAGCNQSHLDLVTLEFDNVMNPSPANGSTVPVGDVDLSWTNLDPNFPGQSVYVDVWFGTEPNVTDPGYDMTKVVTANPGDPDRTTWTVSAPTEGTYYWQVNSYIYGAGLINELNMIEGALWSFNAVEDLAPTIVIDTSDQMTWSSQSVPLDATVTNDTTSATTIEWTAAGGANITVGFDPSAAVEDPTVTITKVPYSAASIVNAGFEDPPLADGSWVVGAATGWSSVGAGADVGTWDPDAADGYGGAAPEGENIAYVYATSNDSGLAQVLTETLTADTTYELTVKVGQTAYYAGYGWPGYKVQLLAGGNLLEEDPNTMIPAPDTFETSTVTFDSTGVAPGLVGEPLEIRLLIMGTAYDTEIEFDDVQLTANPPFPAPTGIETVTMTVAVSDAGNPTPDTDTMEIDVYDNACQLARIGLGLSEITDFDENCITDIRDFGVFAAAWLDDYAATGPVPKP